MADATVSLNSYRFLTCNKFAPRGSEEPVSFVRIHGLGRYFPDNNLLARRRSTHLLTQSIQNYKCAYVNFPKAWIEAVSCFIHTKTLRNRRLVITAIPPRSGRMSHLICLLREIEQSGYLDNFDTTIEPLLLFYERFACRSGYKNMTLEERFENIGRAMSVGRPEELADHPQVVVLDDCVFTGASLYHAVRCLKDAGASNVLPLALSLSVNTSC